MSATEVTIEPARPQDAETLLRIQREAWLDTYPSQEYGITKAMIEQRFNQLSPTEAIAKWQRRIERQGPTKVTFVARLGDKVKGFVGCRFVGDQRRIGAMYVEPDEQGHGIGGKLMQRAIDWFGRDQDIYLHVVSYNEHAIGFYKHYGFEETGVRVTDAVKPFANGVEMPEIEMVLRAA